MNFTFLTTKVLTFRKQKFCALQVGTLHDNYPHNYEGYEEYDIREEYSYRLFPEETDLIIRNMLNREMDRDAEIAQRPKRRQRKHIAERAEDKCSFQIKRTTSEGKNVIASPAAAGHIMAITINRNSALETIYFEAPYEEFQKIMLP